MHEIWLTVRSLAASLPDRLRKALMPLSAENTTEQ
jgi:hypothetical protein